MKKCSLILIKKRNIEKYATMETVDIKCEILINDQNVIEKTKIIKHGSHLSSSLWKKITR